MNDSEYKSTMDQLVHAFQMFVTMSDLDDATLRHLEETVSRADEVGFMLVPPMELGRANRRLDQQRRLLEFVRQGHELNRELLSDISGASS